MKNYTSSISRHDWSLHRKGAIDQERHKQKIREAIKKNLADIVSEEAIILSDGKKIVRVPIRSLEEYRFRYDPGAGRIGGRGTARGKAGVAGAPDRNRERGSAAVVGASRGVDTTGGSGGGRGGEGCIVAGAAE